MSPVQANVVVHRVLASESNARGEIVELRAQLAEVEWRMGVVNDNDRPRYESLAKRIKAYLARVTGEQS
jgi:hypothetical protein